MVKGVTGSAEVIFQQIEFLFMDQVGPIASVLAQEALGEWLADLSSSKKKPSLRNISGYVELLANQIMDSGDRLVFIQSVYVIDALAPFKSHFKGEKG